MRSSQALQSALVIGLVAVTGFGPWGGASQAQGTDAGRPAYRAGDVPLPEEVVLAVRSYGRDHHYYLNFGLSTSDCGKKTRWWYGNEGRLCVLDLRTGALRSLVDDPRGCVRDPQVHYDGRRILFSWRKAGSTDDPDYQAILADIRATAESLPKRHFNLSDFVPHVSYLAILQRYGVLPDDFPTDQPVDPYALDQRYWSSLHH